MERFETTSAIKLWHMEFSISTLESINVNAWELAEAGCKYSNIYYFPSEFFIILFVLEGNSNLEWIANSNHHIILQIQRELHKTEMNFIMISPLISLSENHICS